MLQPTLRKIAITCIVTLLLTPLLAFNGDWIWSQQTDGSIHLQAPPFFNSAQAQGGTFADEEAGIAAYFNAGRQIDLNNAGLRSLYRTFDAQTSEYLLGSAYVSETNADLDYSDNDDAKLYVSAEGWIMAFYPNTAPTSKIFDWLNWDGSGNLPTKLNQVLNDVASRVSASQPTPLYYHFAFPNANRMMLIADELLNADTNSLNIFPPDETNFEYFEWSWSLASLTKSNYDAGYLLNNVEIARLDQGEIQYAAFSTPRPIAGQTNIITIKGDYSGCCNPHGMGGLAIIYKVPQ